MPLVKGGAVVEDGWTHLADDAPLPNDGRPVTMALPRWREGREDLLAGTSLLGVRLANTDPVDELAPYLGRLALVTLHFPRFTDGRAYGQARRLRRFHAYPGEIRATGNVLLDQLLSMVRSGFDAFVIDAPDAAGRYRAAVGAITHFYQPHRTTAAAITSA